MYLPPLVTKTIETQSLPHHENEREWGINDVWSCIMGKLAGYLLHTLIDDVLVAVRGQKSTETLLALS